MEIYELKKKTLKIVLLKKFRELQEYTQITKERETIKRKKRKKERKKKKEHLPFLLLHSKFCLWC